MASEAEAIYSSLVQEFPHAMQSITTLCKNVSEGREFIRSDVQAFNFDSISNIAGDNPVKEKTPDVLFLKNDALYFVEFKEGSHEKLDIRMKIHEGILSLFQYAKSRSISSRSSFLNLKIGYAVLRRFSKKSGPAQQSFLTALELSQDAFGLKNLEGFLVDRTWVRSGHQEIFRLLRDFSNGEIDSIEIIARDQVTVEFSA